MAGNLVVDLCTYIVLWYTTLARSNDRECGFSLVAYAILPARTVRDMQLWHLSISNVVIVSCPVQASNKRSPFFRVTQLYIDTDMFIPWTLRVARSGLGCGFVDSCIVRGPRRTMELTATYHVVSPHSCSSLELTLHIRFDRLVRQAHSVCDETKQAKHSKP